MGMLYRWLVRAGQDPDCITRYAVVVAALWSWLLGWVFGTFFNADDSFTRQALLALQWLSGPIAWLTLLVGWWGRWRWAAWWWSCAIWAMTAVYCWYTSPLHAASVMNLAVVVVFVWWALGRNEALGAAAITGVLFIALGVHGNVSWYLVCYGIAMLAFFAVAVMQSPRWLTVRLRGHHGLPSDDAAQGERALSVAHGDVVRPDGVQATDQLLAQALLQSPESLLMVDQQGRVVFANATFLQQSGYALDEVLGRQSIDVSATGLSQAERQRMRQVVASGGAWRGVLSNRRKDGSMLTESICISGLRDAHGQQTHFVELKQDITELLAAQHRITQLLNFDTLTMLPNRYALLQRLQELLTESAQRAAREQRWHALLLIDMDRFSKFNAAKGIAWSDGLLRAVAQRLGQLLPPGAWVARTTGDEFAVVLAGVADTRVDARLAMYALAQSLQTGMSELTVELQSPEVVQVSFAMGITVFPFVEPHRSSDSVDHILRRASMALRQAKAKGVGEVHAFSEALVESSERKVAVEKGLYEALAHNHLRMYVQPQVDADGRTVSVETLIRWQDPQQGLVPPGLFIPVAEESELIVLLGDWMLDHAGRLLTEPVVRQAGYGISVNVSAKQFMQPNFVQKVQRVLQQYEVPMGRLTLEITESMVLSEVEEVIRKLTTLRALGVHFALDDFGTGYSSLSYLRRLPIQEIKIDQSFIHDLEPDSSAGTLVQALLMLAKHMQLKVVAEGVETELQATVLRNLDPGILCQGFHYGQPQPVQEWLEKLTVAGNQSGAAPVLPTHDGVWEQGKAPNR